MQLAFLGLGVMGGAMAANLARAGYTVTAWNRTPDRDGVRVAAAAGAQVVPTLAEAVESAAIVLTCVTAAADVAAVLAAAPLAAGTIAIDCSTIGVSAAQAIGQDLAQRGVQFLDAPVSGGDLGAQNASLTFMVGGDRAPFETIQPYLTAMGKAIHYCGPLGSGQAIKLCNQILCVANLLGVCEALQLAQTAGLDPAQVIEVCGGGAAASWMLSQLGPKVAAADYAPGFKIEHMLKDLRLVQAASEALELNLPGTDLVTALLAKVATMGGGSEGTQALIRAYSPHNKNS